jgi:hypothetical protein
VVAVAPDLGFPEKVESRALNDVCGGTRLVSPKEDGCAEDPFEGGDQSAVLLAAFRQPERVKHLRRAPEPHNLALLLHRQGCQKDWNQSVLPIRQSEVRVSRQLKDEMPVPALINQLVCRRTPDRQAAQHERTRRESQALGASLPLLSNE